ncbi:MAG TPA: methyltransferase domain-containing protein, partial [Firmicutes bacterium]|nr:methyltransferase domain-containing protein [Bacillota bacterium]
EKRAPLGITYCQGDMTDLGVFGRETFDAATAYLSLADCIDQRAAMREAARVLKKRGRLVYCLPHPCFFTPGANWEPRDRLRISGSDRDKLHWKVDRYFYRERVNWMVYPDLPASTPHFHRPLQDYLDAARETGLQVTRIVEPAPSAQLLAETGDWEKYLRIGFYLVVLAEKAR